jgi:SAM-dependent methyltransferase
MMADMTQWSAGEKYEPYVGRWSRVVAGEFLAWLEVPAGARWLDVGCGTGALSSTIVETRSPAGLLGLDASQAYVDYARAHVMGDAVAFAVSDARALGAPDDSFDAVVSGLVLNFVPEPPSAVAEMHRVARAGAVVAAYVWDYPGEMWLMRHFWEAAIELDPVARERYEGQLYSFCRPDVLESWFAGAGLDAVESRPVVVPTAFADFDDYWSPFLGGQGPAPFYAQSLDESHLVELREAIRARLPVAADGAIPLTARAWAVRGRA